MKQIIITFLLLVVLQLIVWEAIVLGIAWTVGVLASISVNYWIIGGIVAAIWLLQLLAKLSGLYMLYKEDE